MGCNLKETGGSQGEYMNINNKRKKLYEAKKTSLLKKGNDSEPWKVRGGIIIPQFFIASHLK